MTGVLHPIAAGTLMTFCRLCQRPIFFISVPGGRKMAIDFRVDGGYPPSERDEGRGVNHLETCPKADAFRAQAKARQTAPTESYG